MRDIFLEGRRPYAWIFGLVLALYLKSLFFGFTFFDDNDLIVQNAPFLSNISNIFNAFLQGVYPGSTVTQYYRPLLIVSFILDAQIGGLSPFVYHATNVLIHIVVSSLVFALLVRLGFRRSESLFFACIFAVHPALTQAVAWVPGRNDTMLAAFVVASFMAFMRYIDRPGLRHYALHLFFLMLGLFTKESALILIALSYLYLIIMPRRRTPDKIRWSLSAGYIGVFLVWALARYFATRQSEPVAVFEMFELVVRQVPALIQLTGKALFPLDQSVFPIMRDSTCIYGAAAIGAIVCLLFATKRWRSSLTIFGVCWLVLFLIPPLIRPHAPVINDVLEHRLYLPIIGLIIIIADAVKDVGLRMRRYLAFLGLAIIVLFFTKSSFYLDNFSSPISFWESAVKTSWRSAFVRMKLGEVYYRADRLDEALFQIEEGMKLDFYSGISGHYYLGHIYLKKAMPDKAEKEFRKAVALMPENDWALLSLGVVCYNNGKTDEAERYWIKALGLRPDNVDAMRNLAVYYADRGDLGKARSFAEGLRRLGMEPPPEFMKKIGG